MHGAVLQALIALNNRRVVKQIGCRRVHCVLEAGNNSFWGLIKKSSSVLILVSKPQGECLQLPSESLLERLGGLCLWGQAYRRRAFL